ncbi:MAG: ABC transporter ATP-binding protein/permease [Lachnospiraceae bacterium]|nr:ABC transporter ATP-binding protein/permease [Lachnospiraceae bacterium]
MGEIKKSVNQDTMKRIIKLLKPYWLLVVLSIVCASLVVATTLYAPILIGNAVDLIVAVGDVDFFGVVAILYRLVLVILATALFQWCMNQCNNHITYRVVSEIRTKTFAHIQGLPLSYLDAHSTGDVLNHVITDVDQFSDGLLLGFSQLFTGVVTILGTLIFMLTVNPWITLVVVILTPVSFVVASFVAKTTYQLFQQQSKVRGELTAQIDEMVGNQKVVQAFNHEGASIEEFEKVNATLQDVGHRAIFFSSITNPATRFVNSLVYAAVGVAGAYAVIRGMMSVGQLSAFLSYASQYTKPFNEISGVITELQNAFACASEVFRLLDEAEVYDRENAKDKLDESDGTVEISHLSFSYDKSRTLLTDVNISVKPGQRVAIVGPTGCGKSTLINLLMRFYDVDEGEILVDGVETRDITRHALRERFGMVLQETWLQAGTIRENIAYGKADATEEEIIEAAKLAHAHSFIRRLPQGYDTVLSENGGNLSQGQKQLLCIARVMLKLPPVLILDEATSSIDTRTEIRIQKAFNELMHGRTSFVVAHRLSTIRESDIILVMKDGNIIEQGNHEELMAQGGFYKNLYMSAM